MTKELPTRYGAGIVKECWGWKGVTLDGHRIEVAYYWGWYLQVELTTEKFERYKDHNEFVPDKTWVRLATGRDESMVLFARLTGLYYKDGVWRKDLYEDCNDK